MTARDSESHKFFDYRPREAFLSGFLVTRCHTVTPVRVPLLSQRQFKHQERGHIVNMSEVRFRTAEVAKLAEVSLRQLQLWEERRVALASRSGRVRLYTASQALFVIVVAELRRRGLSFQRLRRLSTALRQLLDDHELLGKRPSPLHAFILTDGRQVQFADSPNKTIELVSNFFRPLVCISLADCLNRIEKTGLME